MYVYMFHRNPKVESNETAISVRLMTNPADTTRVTAKSPKQELALALPVRSDVDCYKMLGVRNRLLRA